MSEIHSYILCKNTRTLASINLTTHFCGRYELTQYATQTVECCEHSTHKVYMHAHMHICIHACIHAYIYTCIYRCVHSCKRAFVCVCVCVRVCVCACVYRCLQLCLTKPIWIDNYLERLTNVSYPPLWWSWSTGNLRKVIDLGYASHQPINWQNVIAITHKWISW